MVLFETWIHTWPLISHFRRYFLCSMFLSGPILTGYTQTLNDWEDREIDAINEPYRPIPSGAISEGQVIAQIWTLLLSGIALAYGLDQWAGHADPIITKLTVFGCFICKLCRWVIYEKNSWTVLCVIAYIYSAPPLKLKAAGWAGSFALGSSYISLPWLCGQAMFGMCCYEVDLWSPLYLSLFYLSGELSLPVTILTIFYSLAGLGIAIVNDFKSIEGDRWGYKSALLLTVLLRHRTSSLSQSVGSTVSSGGVRCGEGEVADGGNDWHHTAVSGSVPLLSRGVHLRSGASRPHRTTGKCIAHVSSVHVCMTDCMCV